MHKRVGNAGTWAHAGIEEGVLNFEFQELRGPGSHRTGAAAVRAAGACRSPDTATLPPAWATPRAFRGHELKLTSLESRICFSSSACQRSQPSSQGSFLHLETLDRSSASFLLSPLPLLPARCHRRSLPPSEAPYPIFAPFSHRASALNTPRPSTQRPNAELETPAHHYHPPKSPARPTRISAVVIQSFSNPRNGGPANQSRLPVFVIWPARGIFGFLPPSSCSSTCHSELPPRTPYFNPGTQDTRNTGTRSRWSSPLSPATSRPPRRYR